MANRYWVGGGSSSNWDATGPTNWSATDGGGNDASVPSAGDDVYLKSAADCAVNIYPPNLNSFDMTGYTGTMSGTGDIVVNPASGTVNLIFGGTITWTGYTRINPQSGATVKFTTNGKTLRAIYIGNLANGTGTVEQQDAVNSTGNFVLIRGTYKTNGFAYTTALTLGESGSSTRALNITNSTISCKTVDLSATNLTFTVTGSTINLNVANGSIYSTGITFNVVNFPADSITLGGSCTYSTMNVNNAGLATGLKITAGTTQTVTNFGTNGYASNLAKILSTSDGSAFTLTTASAQISVDYMSIKDSTVAQINTWYAGANSINVSGNTNWIFTAPPAAGPAIPVFMAQYRQRWN